MGVIVPRTVTWFAGHRNPACGAKLSEFRDTPFYVLLGDPGAGKTTAFEQEADVDANRLYLTARDFVRFHADPKPEWQGKTLFIDGLDEVRAGRQDLRKPLDQILIGLHHLGGPHARLSCRSAGWLATNDGEELRSLRGYEHAVILRLDPLPKQGARAILGHLLGDEADNFLAEARKRSLHGLLDNPLTLGLLTKAVGPGKGWPESRVDTFERACLAVVAEYNDEHAATYRYASVGPRHLLSGASRMAAFLLLTGKDGIAWDQTDVPEPERLLLINDLLDSCAEPGGRGRSHREQPSSEGMRRALDTGLFVGESPGTFAPTHPHIAEYLAARHLAKAIDDGAVLGRVLTLLTSGGGVPSPLRGVAAWLAALCGDARRALVEIDPVGVLAYGEVGVFTEDDRTHLLSHLAKDEGLWHRPPHLSGTVLGGLASPKTMARLREYLDGRDRSERAQQAMVLLLRGIAAAPSRCGDSISGRHLIGIARDATWSPLVRDLAVEAAVQLPSDECDLAQQLQLLQDMNEGNIEDPYGNMRTSLFGALYPEHIPLEDTWSWISAPVPPSLEAVLLRRSSPEGCRALLDALCIGTTPPAHSRDPSLASLTWRVLARALDAPGEEPEVAKLYDWIELAAFDPNFRDWELRQDDTDLDEAFQGVGFPGAPDSIPSGAPWVQAWLARRPTVQQALLLEFLRRDRREDYLAYEATRFWNLVSGVGRPDDFHRWCLEQALAMSGTAAEAAGWLVGWAMEPLRRSASADEWLATGLEWVGNDIVLAEQLEALAERDRELRRRELAYTTRRLRDRTGLASQVMDHRDALLTAAGPVELIVSLGQVYWGRPFNREPHIGEDRLRDAMASRQDATQIALQSLSAVPTADAGPSISQIAQLDCDGRSSRWGWPYLAGLDAIDRRGGHVLEVLGDEITRALWFYFATPLGCKMPLWFDNVLRASPDQVAKVIVDLHRHRIRSKVDNTSTLSAMAEDERYREAAKIALPTLLRAFPAKGYGAQLEMLRHVLALAIRYTPGKVTARVRDRMQVRQMNVAQRATWLGAGVAVAPTEFASTSVTFVEKGKVERAKHLIDGLYSAWRARGEPLFGPEGPASAVAELVRVLGARCQPLWDGLEIGAPAFAVITDNGSQLVEHLVGCLASSPRRDAGVQLESLSRDKNLEDWHNMIRSALERQRTLHYDTEHTVLNVGRVQRVLAGGPPASAADLAALVVDQLRRLGGDIRHGSTDGWRQYWNEEVVDRRVTPIRPKPENSCRDALLSALNRCLPSGVDARREASYAENARADVRVSSGSFGVPLEIKKSSHRQLWRAVQSQLMAKYARDPESSGHGVYVVLWFGANGPEPAKPPPTGPRPKSAGELARRLEEDLTPEERGRIKVVVIDVSLPDKQETSAI